MNTVAVNTDNTPAAAKSAPTAVSTTTLLGLDLGTNCSALKACPLGAEEASFTDILPTVVGYTKDGIVSGVLPGNSTVFFGEEALRHRLHLRLVDPLEDGVVDDPQATRDFLKHVRERLDPDGKQEIRTVIGVPANADQTARDTLREVVTGIFESVLLIPEPFLAALGVREEKRIGTGRYIDPVNNSLFIDIGAGTTDLCMIQGYYPTAQDQISIPVAGDAVDELLQESIQRSFPDTALSILKVRGFKEAHAFCGEPGNPINVKVVVGGKPRTLEISHHLSDACNTLVKKIHESLIEIIPHASSDSVEEMLQNIIITGGGSQIKNIAEELQKMLVGDGYEAPMVRTLGPEYKELVAIGALKAARQARPNQWQHLVG